MCTQVDLDLGASGAIPIKGKYVITGGKQGPLYIADAMDLGGYEPLANNTNVFQVRNPPAGSSPCQSPAAAALWTYEVCVNASCHGMPAEALSTSASSSQLTPCMEFLSGLHAHRSKSAALS